MILAWIIVAAAFLVPLLIGVVLDSRNPSPGGLKHPALFYVWLPLGASLLAAFLLRSELLGR
jgi:hypothetical protein